MPAKKKKKTHGNKKTTAKKVKALKALNPPPKKEEVVEGEIVDQGEGNDRWGRPTVVTEEVKRLALEAYAWGCSNVEAGLHAGVSRSTLERYMQKDLEFKERAEELKNTPVLRARAKIVEAAMSSPYYALKFLERVKADEFSIRVRQMFEDPEPITPEEQEILDQAIDDNL